MWCVLLRLPHATTERIGWAMSLDRWTTGPAEDQVVPGVCEGKEDRVGKCLEQLSWLKA